MEIRILVEGEGLANVQEVVLVHGTALREITVAVASKAGFASEEAFLFVEDEDTPLDLALAVDENFDRKRVYHVHRARTVEIIVHYNGRVKTRGFAPSTRVQRVLAWAIGADGFNIDPPIAPEMELAIEGQTAELPGGAHIGRYARHQLKLELNLIRGVVPNGSAL